MLIINRIDQYLENGILAKNYIASFKSLGSHLYKSVYNNKIMPVYVLLSTLTDEGAKTIKSKPERIKEVNKEIEAFGVKVLHQYAVLGPYDFVNIVEAPNNETIFKLSVELSSRGTIKIMSMPAIPTDELISMIRK